MVVLTGLLCTVIVTIREARGTSFNEEIAVASTIYTRSAKNNLSLCDTVFQKNQYSSMNKTKRKNKFKSYDEMFKYYNIDTSGNDFFVAMQAVNIAQDQYRNNEYYYFHDHRIKNFRFNAGKPVSTTKNFKFYKEC